MHRTSKCRGLVWRGHFFYVWRRSSIVLSGHATVVGAKVLPLLLGSNCSDRHRPLFQVGDHLWNRCHSSSAGRTVLFRPCSSKAMVEPVDWVARAKFVGSFLAATQAQGIAYHEICGKCHRAGSRGCQSILPGVAWVFSSRKPRNARRIGILRRSSGKYGRIYTFHRFGQIPQLTKRGCRQPYN
jgi:hypothetical protein